MNGESESTEQTQRSNRRWWIVTGIATLLILMLLPPFVNLGRYRRHVANSISSSLGRPVRIDGVSLRLLPTPAFILQNFVVGENPAFGYEPFMRANTVTATLHVSSLWRGRLEFATITLDSPSLNLVRNTAGEWNLQSIVLQAAQVHTAPTEQRTAGSVPRFPYIQATQARVDIKLGEEKMPFSLTDAKLGLWLSQPETWHVRMEAHPLRTDMNATDTGTLQLEGTLQRAPQMDAIPLDLKVRWRNAQLGDVSHMILREDAGWRGSIDAEATVTGLFGDAQVDSHVKLDGLRRADFEPERTLALEGDCSGHALHAQHSMEEIRCAMPIGDGELRMEGGIDNILGHAKPQLTFTAERIPAAQLLEIARHVTDRIAPELTATGTIDGTFHYGTPLALEVDTMATAKPDTVAFTGNSTAHWSGSATLPTLTLTVPGITAPITAENLQLHSAEVVVPAKKHRSAPIAISGLILEPFTLPLGGATPATVEGTLHRHDYTLHLHGSVMRSQLLSLAQAVPQFGDGIDAVLPQPPVTPAVMAEKPISVDLTAQRTWGGPGMDTAAGPFDQSGEVWSAAAAPHKRR